jgi:hypothetical protein
MKLPQYAQGVPLGRLVRVLCKGPCARDRYFEVSRTPWTADENAADLFATCLKCGHKTRDKYNWRRV